MRLTPVPDPARAVRDLHASPVNYEPGRTGGRRWHHDEVVRALPPEAPGPPVPGGSWELAWGVVRDYEFADPRILRGYFFPAEGDALAGGDMLLVGRFGFLRFPMGVRVDTGIDEVRTAPDGARLHCRGWSYQTLGDHLERGRLVYEVIKNANNGEVTFVITGVSRGARIANPIVRAGFRVFGRRMQRRFYRGCGRRLARLVERALDGVPPPIPEPAPRAAGTGLVVAPTTRSRR